MNTFLKVLEESPERNFFQEVPLWRSPVLPDKPKFETPPESFPKSKPPRQPSRWGGIFLVSDQP
jgi:hypothetical protein